MRQLRYEKLTQYFHCSVEGQEDAQYKVRKVRPMITRCEAKFGACFQLGKNVSIDKVMVKFDGRLGRKQYMPLKPSWVLQCLLRLHWRNSRERWP
ncbi:hypothetical protein NP493_158g03017 [Ridgeia piscesae]|uniref:PiggyBac transposable element-derived protein domain-containing protein n=1 Tax=Ridgeia piscesae TaxID=27915 RepID=A0AAD9P3V5_RIDPI|nr:hypothetical protein NP493_158g03017 [Ridgeia piscesae]